LTATKLRDHIVTALEDGKGQDIKALDVAKLTPMTDYMILVSGTSNRHVKSLVDQVIDAAKSCGARVRGVEGRENNEWVLVDLGDVIVHAMQKEAREFYDLERLWVEMPADSETSV
jgi:ribosome-associated protein